MTELELNKIIAHGENVTTEFKSWVKVSGMKERINLAVKELVAFANTKGGTLYYGIEDDGTVTGCMDYDTQSILEGIYDKTRPPLYCDIEEIDYDGKTVIAIHVKAEAITYSTSSSETYRRLGKNSKPLYPEQMKNSNLLSINNDFSARIITESTVEDINLLEVYNLKEKLKIRDPKSTLPLLDDIAFLKDLGLLRTVAEKDRLTVAGMLFVGKEKSIKQFLPQAEVIYLHYGSDNLEEYDGRIDMKMPIVSVLDRLTDKIQNSNTITNIQIGLFRIEVEDFPEKVFQEAVLNALSHRDYENSGSIYVKHYPDKIVIENPGGLLDGITERNIITHPSVPRNKLIAETLQRLKYVQRSGQGVDIIFREMVSMGKPYPEYYVFSDAVRLTLKSTIEDLSFVKFVVREQEKSQSIFSLPELMILRYLSHNKKIKLSDVIRLTQIPSDEARRHCSNLVKRGLIEVVGKEYMLTAKVYSAIKSEVEYAQDKVVLYIKAKDRIIEYLKVNKSISNETIRVLCGYTKQQARTTINRMREEKILGVEGKSVATRYYLIVVDH